MAGPHSHSEVVPTRVEAMIAFLEGEGIPSS